MINQKARIQVLNPEFVLFMWELHFLALVKKFPPAYRVAYGKPWDRLELKTTSQGYKQPHIPSGISNTEYLKGLDLKRNLVFTYQRQML
ncbi:hypothetical protein JTF06_12875 [Desemzia sp. RIT804]|uniref:hypothetical protein n=1 Tax=Desemzia sp. RIT 804 TaxID=2810209 RepID=UPI001950F001|nr:hypothetical protein [Desemzia sp. RIT 804]MBM6615779.1 hypothetical protein [Desemzia sp. RIT 804]